MHILLYGKPVALPLDSFFFILIGSEAGSLAENNHPNNQNLPATRGEFNSGHFIVVMIKDDNFLIIYIFFFWLWLNRR